jgi:hypothetical protein
MKISFVKNIQFTKLIKVKGQLKEFNFRKSNGRTETQFTVDVIDERGNRIIFHMMKKDTSWQIITPELPRWVLEKETSLDEIITEELKQG